MAVLRGIPRKMRLGSYRGRIMIDAVRGVLRVRRWPRKRGPPKSTLHRWWIDWFKQANLLAKYADPMSQVRAKEMSEGTGMYPRDILLMAMAGRLYFWADQTGWKWYSMAAIGDVSESLDVLAQSIGSVLVRAVDRWRAPAPGVIGQVLTYQGPDAAPTWEPAAGGGGYGGGVLVDKSASQSLLNNSWTAVTFDQEQYDTDNIHDLVVDNTRLVVPAGVTRVRLTANINLTTIRTNTRVATFWKNGASFPGTPYHRMNPGYTVPIIFNLASPVLIVIPGDYFELMAWQNSGGTIQISPGNITWASLDLVA